MRTRPWELLVTALTFACAAGGEPDDGVWVAARAQNGMAAVASSAAVLEAAESWIAMHPADRDGCYNAEGRLIAPELTADAELVVRTVGVPLCRTLVSVQRRLDESYAATECAGRWYRVGTLNRPIGWILVTEGPDGYYRVKHVLSLQELPRSVRGRYNVGTSIHGGLREAQQALGEEAQLSEHLRYIERWAFMSRGIAFDVSMPRNRIVSIGAFVPTPCIES